MANGTLRCAKAHAAAFKATGMQRRLGQDALRVRIERAIAAGQVPAEVDAGGLAAFYAAMVQGMSVQAVDGATTEELLKLADYAMAAWPTEWSTVAAGGLSR